MKLKYSTVIEKFQQNHYIQTEFLLFNYIFIYIIYFFFYKKYYKVMGIKGRRVHMIEELSETIISFQRGKDHTLKI